MYLNAFLFQTVWTHCVHAVDTVGGNKKFPFVSRATEQSLPFRPRSKPNHFPFNCRLTSGPFLSIVIKWLFRSSPLCWNDRSVPFLFCKRLLRSLFWNDRSLRWKTHFVETIVPFIILRRSFNYSSNCTVRFLETIVRCLGTIVRCLETIAHCIEVIAPLC